MSQTASLDNSSPSNGNAPGGTLGSSSLGISGSKSSLINDDAPICRTLDAYESIQGEQTRDSVLRWLFDMTGTPDPVWLPTGAYALLRAIRHVPNHELLLADFDFLPNVVIAGENAPIVSSTVGGRAVDRGELLSAPFGSVDVFFPTNFRLLSAMYRSMHPTGQVCVEKAGSFLQATLPEGDQPLIRTQDGAAPLFDDYENTNLATDAAHAADVKMLSQKLHAIVAAQFDE